MKKINKKNLLILILTILYLNNLAFSQIKPKITFIEIGSVTCIPCKKMQPIMRNIEKKYAEQIKVIFHDIKNEKEIIEKYKVNIIPTQVFLDENGKEIHRHVGYFPEVEIDKFLKKIGLKAKQ